MDNRVGWDRSGSVFRAKVAEMRPLFAGLDPTDRTVYEPGDIVQCDLWFPNKPVPLAARVAAAPPVLTMTMAWCGFLAALMIPSRTVGDLLAGMWRLVSTQLSGVPKKLVWDHESGIGRDRLGVDAAAFAGTLGCRVVQVRNRQPEHKGVIERSHGFLETSFEPGRRFASPEDFNAQLVDWLGGANRRLPRRTGRRPADLVGEEREAMAPLPGVAPRTGFHDRVRLGRDYYVRVLGNDYSVDPSAVGRMVDVEAGLEEVVVSCGGVEAARRQRLWTARQVAADPAHKERAAQLRAAYDEVHAERARREAAGRARLVPLRALSDYDDMFGVPGLADWPRPVLAVVE